SAVSRQLEADIDQGPAEVAVVVVVASPGSGFGVGHSWLDVDDLQRVMLMWPLYTFRTRRGSMSLPEVVTREEWLAARKQWVVREKEHTGAGDALSSDRRRLPMVEITKEYAFEGPAGRVTLSDLFEGRRQLMVQHFMFGPTWEAGCPSCTGTSD